MFVLGVDPGLTTTGYGLLLGGLAPTVHLMGVIRTDPSRSVSERLAELHKDLASVMADFPPTVVAIEQVFTNANRRTAMNVGRASGVAMLAAAQQGVDVAEYTPTAVKAAVTGDGRATKSQVQQVLMRRLRLATLPEPFDAADALALAMCHLQSIRLEAVG